MSPPMGELLTNKYNKNEQGNKNNNEITKWMDESVLV